MPSKFYSERASRLGRRGRSGLGQEAEFRTAPLPSRAELAPDLLPVEARGLEGADHEGDVFLREVLGPVSRQGDLDPRSFVLDVSAHAALETTEAVVEQPRLQCPTRYLSCHVDRPLGATSSPRGFGLRERRASGTEPREVPFPGRSRFWSEWRSHGWP